MLSRKLEDFFSGSTKNKLIKTLFKMSWGRFRNMPKVSQKSFTQLWQEQQQSDKE
jgi:L-lactate dehydrogenase complex protein LldF